jgi:adenylate kinase
MSTTASALFPVIVVTGTPGTGKTTLAQLLEEQSPIPLKHINVGEWVKEKKLYQSWDSEWQSYDVDEDKVSTCHQERTSFEFHSCQLVDDLEPLVSEGGTILDWHSCEVFPERWADLVVVLRCDHSLLWQRLEERCHIRSQ